MTATLLSQALPWRFLRSPACTLHDQRGGRESFLNDLNGHDYRLNCNEPGIPSPALGSAEEQPDLPTA